MGSDGAPTNDPLRRVALADEVYQRLIARIMDGSLGSGEPLRIMKLAADLGISPTPLREALSRLEGQGLVVRHPMRGFQVAEPLSSAELDMLMNTRALIEPEIAAATAGAVTEEVTAAITRNAAEIRAVSVKPHFEGYRRYLELSAEFHDVIGAACPNRFLTAAFAALPVHVQRFRLFGEEGVTDVDVSLDEHERIAAAIIAGDAAAAASAMRAHVLGVHDRSASAISRAETSVDAG